MTRPTDPSPPVVTVVVAVMARPEPEVEESNAYLFVPEPFWITRAVVDEIFISSPPAAVKPD